MDPEKQIVGLPEKYSEARLQQNKQQMLKILKEAPVAGVYLEEDEAEWQTFFNFYLNFLKSEIGPRGDCTKAVRAQLAKQPQFYDEVLQILKMTHKSHIRDIYVKYKTFSPCNEYDELLKVQENLQKNQQSYKRIMDETSIMYNQIKNGMLDKRGPDYDYKTQIENIREKYKEKLIFLRQKAEKLKQFLDKNDSYLKYMRMKNQMQQFFSMWKEADMRVGHESVEKGDTFQKIVKSYLLPLLCKRSGVDQHAKIRLETNCRWYPKSLGQIDIAIIVFDEDKQKWIAKVLIQCKSRLFDIREAYKQVAVLKQKGKQKLTTSIGILDLDENPKHLIVTTLPENPFHLPIESKLKQMLEKAAKNIPIDEIKSEQVYPIVKQFFKDEISPLAWFVQNNSDNIIVLKY